MDRRKQRQRKRPEIKQVYANKRLEQARTYAFYTPEMWSDKYLIERRAGIRLIWTFLRSSEQILERDLQEKRYGKSVKKIFWVAFSQTLRTGLILLDGDPTSARGRVTARVIIDLYQ